MSKFDDEFKNGNIMVWDNDGETTDRYTVLIDKEYVFSMSGSPFHPQGFNQYAGNINDWEVYKDVNDFEKIWNKKENRMNEEDIPEVVKKAIIGRMESE